jgi:hypothetical protein
MIDKTIEEVNDYVRPLLTSGINFDCKKVSSLKTKSNRKSKFYRLEFTWEKDGKSFSLGRRCKSSAVLHVIDGYIEEVNRIYEF